MSPRDIFHDTLANVFTCRSAQAPFVTRRALKGFDVCVYVFHLSFTHKRPVQITSHFYYYKDKLRPTIVLKYRACYLMKLNNIFLEI